MSDFLPEAVRKGLEDARVAMLRKSGRLCVHDGDQVYRISKVWDGGFAVVAKDSPRLRGLVEIYDGPRHLAQCLIMASQEENDLMLYEYKRSTAVSDRPPLDFATTEARPAGLLPLL
ncbi:hypothetical protein [Flavimaricola marinus]|uniref:Uncharacterized protein n=1 Tax=Flavimaricola marinus TaxID=1819565 RepID=A0A238LAP2_9RHOB|nr:hypothetical protein [Flavimaricola marinus]SMY06494.1 hypothetical protein LOM8899_00619 [Flavimaricola marinus]